MRQLALASALVCLAGCASYTPLAPQERATLERELTGRGRERFLKLSYYVTPFFGDAGKKLLSPVPPDEVRLLDEPNGSHIQPGPVEKIIPAGTRARIVKVEFPTAWAVTERLVYTPRTQPWVYLEVEGEPTARPFILVLRPQIKTQTEFVSELDRYLTEQDPNTALSSWTEAVQGAVREKKALVDMPSEALEMAWGYPELKRVTFDNSVKKEDWIYPDGLRVAHLADGRVVSLDEKRRAP